MNKIKLLLVKVILILVFIGILFFPIWRTQAARIDFDTQSLEVGVGNKFEIGVFLNPQGSRVNAAEGKIAFLSETAEVVSVIEGGSAISFWVEKPVVTKVGLWTMISFAGVSPGGIDGYLFSVILKSVQIGKLEILLNEGSILLDDGQGTRAALESAPFAVSFKEVSATPDINLSLDSDPPELFQPQVVRDKRVAEGKWFVVFFTQDKGMGIDFYEVLETQDKNNIKDQTGWIKATSPYVLKDQSRKSYIYIKATDKAGNSVIADILPAQTSVKSWYQKLLIYVIILSAILIGLFWIIRKRETKS